MGVSTDETFGIENAYLTEDGNVIETLVATGEANYVYTLTNIPNGTYYVIAALYLGETSMPDGALRNGDLIGQFTDGLLPASLANYYGTSAGTPEAIELSGADVSGKSFTLEGTVSGL